MVEFPELSAYSLVASVRNDINHSGMKVDSMQYENMEKATEQLESFYKNVKV